ncbi:hypothetical protein JG688_00003307 [Phytophthora aleatoria]|uniref:Peptidase A1 domain-containing protein n=1 Tax=Phytophthora aleatoria TaxID=2496075 RepID=A0A8J5JAG2_9STRA|nr:hypothetical protein JG688_00003307 [Phytophthora aleatoria]
MPSSELSHRLAHQQARARRRAQEEVATGDGNFALGTLALSEAPLGVGYGTHYAEIHLGIPAQRASSYMEGSMWQAVMVDELVWVGGFSTPSDEMEGVLKTFGFRFPVGCQTKETGLFITQKENGIMGLGRHRSTVMSYMLNAGRVTQNLFTLCFAGDGGELVFGEVDYSHHTSDVGYTPLLDDKSAYYPVHVKDIRMNGVSLGIDAGTINSGRGVIVDSGTTDTFFDSKGSRTFMKAFRNAAGREYSEKRMDLTNDELAALPTISIILSGMKGDGTDDVQLDIPASRYLTPSDNAGSYNGNFHFSERSGGVLGASTMIGFDVIFDTENKRVGFAESDCADTVDVTTSSSTGATSNRASPKFGAFIAEVILISLVGVALAVMASDAVERRAFLDAAADGKLDGVNAWISARRDVNATLGEGWTALLYAVAHSRMGIVQRLLEEETIDLNATTMLIGVDICALTEEQLAGSFAAAQRGFSRDDIT